MRGLTPLKVSNTRPHPSKRLELPDKAKPGLFLVIQPSGHKSWCVRYRRLSDKKPRKLVLAGGLVSLATARKLAQHALDRVAEGGDPAADKQAAKQSPSGEADTFAATTVLFVNRDQKPKNRRWDETARLLGLRADGDELKIIPGGIVDRWGKRRLGEITRREIIDLLDSIVDRGAPYIANRTLSAIRRLYKWCIEKDRIAASPCVGIVPPAEERSRTRVLNQDEIRWFWQACDSLGFPYGTAAQLLLLTGQRENQVGGMRRHEISGGVWHIPDTRSKNKKPHELPLSQKVLDILAAIPNRDDGLIFRAKPHSTAPISGWGFEKKKIDTHMRALAGVDIPRWTYHDLRRTFASGLQRIGIRAEVVERACSHLSGAYRGVAGVYQRDPMTEDVRAALERWAAEVDRIVGGKPADVVTLRRA
jgi:integrase